MNLNQLEYFVRVAENRNFTKAANQCFISQTAMTQQIKSLENAVGVPLLIRDNHHVELTPAGMVYLKEAKAILKRSDDALRMARSASAGLGGELKVGFLSGFGQNDCSEILRHFHESYPDVKLSLYRDTLSGLIESMNRGDCDAAFMLTPRKELAEQVNYVYLRSYPLMAVLDKSHPLAERETLTYADLEKEKFIIMQPSGRAKDEMEEVVIIYERGGFVPNVIALEKEPETILLMVSIGMGISLMPEYIIRLHQKNDDLRIIPVTRPDGSAETIDAGIAWAKDNVNVVVERFVDVCRYDSF